MATIFRALGPRTQLNFPVRTAIIYSGNIELVNIPSGTFTVEFSSGGTTNITLSPPYGSIVALTSDIQSQIDSNIGAGIGQCNPLGNVDAILFYDVANQSVEISNVSNDLFQDFPVPNVTRDVTTSPVTDLQCTALSELGAVESIGIPLNFISNMYEIPTGANELTIWSQVTDNDAENDGYNQSVFYFISWTNGTDGYITDGYLSETYNDSIIPVTQFPIDGADPVQSGIFESKASRLITTTSVRSDGVTIANDVVRVPIPLGATGMYIGTFGYGQNSTGNDGKTASPPTITFAITSGTR